MIAIYVVESASMSAGSIRQDSNGFTTLSANGISPAGSNLEKTKSNYLNTTIIPILILIIMPNFLMCIWYTVVFHNGSYVDFFNTALSAPSFVKFIFSIWSHASIGTPFSLAVIGGYMLFQVGLMIIVPGKQAEGPTTPTGHTPVYKDNGFSIFIITMLTFTLLTVYLKAFTTYSPSIIYDRYGDLLATINVFALFFCLMLYVKGLVAPSTADSGTSGNVIFDFYWGMELYPRIFGVDIKVCVVSFWLKL